MTLEHLLALQDTKPHNAPHTFLALCLNLIGGGQ